MWKESNLHRGILKTIEEVIAKWELVEGKTWFKSQLRDGLQLSTFPILICFVLSYTRYGSRDNLLTLDLNNLPEKTNSVASLDTPANDAQETNGELSTTGKNTNVLATPSCNMSTDLQQ